jgi:DNA-binding MarR family transcriptional regulator
MISNSLRACIDFDLAHATMVKRFDEELGTFYGLNFRDFILLYHLCSTPDEQLPRDELMVRLAVTPVELARMLIPLEKIGLISRFACADKPAIRYVKVLAGGRKLVAGAVTYIDPIARQVGAGLPESQTV